MTVRPELKRACLAVCLMLFSFSGFSEEYRMYKWVDEDGSIHFSQFPPPKEQIPERVKLKVAPPITPVESEFDTPPEETIENQETPSSEASEDASLVEQQKQAFEENCRIARENKQTYENNPGRRFIDADGNVTRFTEEERQAKIQEAQDQIDFYCR